MSTRTDECTRAELRRRLNLGQTERTVGAFTVLCLTGPRAESSGRGAARSFYLLTPQEAYGPMRRGAAIKMAEALDGQPAWAPVAS